MSIENIEKEWKFVKDGKEIKTPTSLIVFGTADNIPCVLKLFNKNSDERLSAKALEHYNGYGAVSVIKFCENAVLLEKIQPATHLKELSVSGKDETATNIYLRYS